MTQEQSVATLAPKDAALAHFKHALEYPGDTRYLQQLQKALADADRDNEVYASLAGYWFANVLLLPPIDDAYGQDRLQDLLSEVSGVRIDETASENPFGEFALEFGRLIAEINDQPADPPATT